MDLYALLTKPDSEIDYPALYNLYGARMEQDEIKIRKNWRKWVNDDYNKAKDLKEKLKEEKEKKEREKNSENLSLF